MSEQLLFFLGQQHQGIAAGIIYEFDFVPGAKNSRIDQAPSVNDERRLVRLVQVTTRSRGPPVAQYSGCVSADADEPITTMAATKESILVRLAMQFPAGLQRSTGIPAVGGSPLRRPGYGGASPVGLRTGVSRPRLLRTVAAITVLPMTR